jgi:23S rRNA pseudouridine955/2504/2580 synthase
LKIKKKFPARTVTVEPDEADRRLDNFLLSRLKDVPRSRVYRMIRGGEVRVNKGRARPDRRLVAGDQVRIPPVESADQVALGMAGGRDAGWIERCIVHEDRELLVLNKPSGLAVHGGSGISSGVIELLRAVRGDGGGRNRLELVHRLDRATSGCLLIAKRRASLRHLQAQFRAGEVHKRYAALLLGKWSGGDRRVTEPLLTSHRKNGERHVRVDAAGKPSTTIFMPETQFDRSVFAWVDIETGRTHQIRAHAAHIGHPVAGDARYGSNADSPGADPVRTQYGLRRLFLHAAQLTFDHPRDERLFRVECPLDDELQTLLDRLSADQP